MLSPAKPCRGDPEIQQRQETPATPPLRTGREESKGYKQTKNKLSSFFRIPEDLG
jgi:hypothetical protein